MDEQQQDSPELTEDPLFPYWKSGETVAGPCDGCGNILSLLVCQQTTTKALVAICNTCYAFPPVELHRPPGSRPFNTP